MDDTGLVLLLVSESAYVDEPLRLIVLIQNLLLDLDVSVDCDDDDGQWSMNVVDRSTKTTLPQATGSNRNRNRHRVAARSRPSSTNADEDAIAYSRLDVVHTFHAVGDRRITVTVRRLRPEVIDNRYIGTNPNHGEKRQISRGLFLKTCRISRKIHG